MPCPRRSGRTTYSKYPSPGSSRSTCNCPIIRPSAVMAVQPAQPIPAKPPRLSGQQSYRRRTGLSGRLALSEWRSSVTSHPCRQKALHTRSGTIHPDSVSDRPVDPRSCLWFERRSGGRIPVAGMQGRFRLDDKAWAVIGRTANAREPDGADINGHPRLHRKVHHIQGRQPNHPSAASASARTTSCDSTRRHGQVVFPGPILRTRTRWHQEEAAARMVGKAIADIPCRGRQAAASVTTPHSVAGPMPGSRGEMRGTALAREAREPGPVVACSCR